MKWGVALVLGAVLPALTYASCPNGCSGNGLCGTNDQCTCNHGFRGNDCSSRTCPFGKAWTTTYQGDLNADGDRYDAAVYSTATKFTTRANVIMDYASGGTFEMWPSNAIPGEGHFQMECSNMGICNTESGECECFAGFEGSACQRSSCPDEYCNNKGRCMTVNQALTEANAADGTSITYDLWDGDMMRTCKCDPHYTGIGCTQRVCPKGDDPLTKVHQIDETQYVRIWSTNIDTIAAEGSLGGTFTLTYTDLEGKAYTTTDIAVQRMDGSAAATAVATNTAAALKALPNQVVQDVEVTAAYCEETLKGAFKADFAAADTTLLAGTLPADNKFIRCPAATITGSVSCADTIAKLVGGTPTAWIQPLCGTTTFLNEVSGCTVLEYPRCIQLNVKFTGAGNSGNLKSLTVDHTKVTAGLNSLTNAASNGASGISSSVTDTLQLTDTTDAASAEYVIGSSVTIEGTHTDASVVSKTITWGTASLTGATTLPAGMKVQIHCMSGGTGNYVDMGEYTIDTTSTAATSGTTTLVDAINDPASECAAGAHVKVVFNLSYIRTNVDLSYTAITSGVGVKIGSTQITSTVSSVANDLATAASSSSYLLLSETPVGVSAVTYGAMHTYLDGAGTKEAQECSSRGNCDTSTGECNCFKGYTGEACQTQNALWTGE